MDTMLFIESDLKSKYQDLQVSIFCFLVVEFFPLVFTADIFKCKHLISYFAVGHFESSECVTNCNTSS
jgi:hypothetical protein